MNSWLTNVIAEGRESAEHADTQSTVGTEQVLLETLYRLRTRDIESIVGPLLRFQGAKLLLSCTGRTPIAQTLKQAFCFADLVIIVPAPLWVSCGHEPGSVRHPEFNYQTAGSADCWEMGWQLLKRLSRLIANEHWAFEEKLVTFLPLPAANLDRWVYPEFAPHELPKPYSGNPQSYTLEDVYVEAFYALCRERLMAERLDALHLNSTSFTTPVFGDLTIGKEDGWIRHITQFHIPDVRSLSLRDVTRLRRNNSDRFAQLSSSLRGVLWAREENCRTPLAIETLLGTARDLARDLERLGENEENRLPLRSFVVGSGGPTGGTLGTVGLLIEGGHVADLRRLISGSADGILRARPHSVFAA